MNRKNVLRLVLAVLLPTTVMLAGCSFNDKENTGDNTASESPNNNEATPSGPIKLEIVESASGLPSPDKDFVKKGLEEALKAEVVLTAYGSVDDYQNQLNVRMASGNIPDLFGVSKVQMEQFQKQNLLLDLTPYIDKELKPVKDFIGEETVKKGMVGGGIYAIPKAPGIPYSTYWIRKDWLDNLKLQPPTTIDEFYDVAKAFTENDPDQNGKKDTVGITGGSLSTFAPLYGAFGTANPGEFYVKDGKVVNSLYEPGMKEALAYINKLVTAGVVDPEIMANTGMQHQDKAIQGKVGIIFIDWANIAKDQYVEQIKKVNPKAEWIQIAAPKGPGGQYDNSRDIGNAGAMFAIPKSLEKDKATLNKVFELLNYVSSEKGSRLVQFGVEGRHYNLKDGKVVPTELMAQETGYTWLYQFTGRPDKEYLSVKFPNQAKYIEFANSRPRLEVLNGFINLPVGYNPADANRYLEEEFTKFVYGKRPLSEYDAYLKTMETSMNYKLYVDSAVKQLNQLGYGKN
ncbi:putative aldouronate transport system substrate-binding protein [Paenibacillus sp. UNCCL117]|uniref:extracellular solute-binding protein n=1 Tax=unclassified Paenibacillus TaxID=185978 RepID=UPI000889DD59|nr:MULTISPECIES: extracellular solute-binding protein [unclassified Paenibacillus]SDC96392.1 carbohydrate ABC transporter substrate-binding protein, CUT1 family [Paenibacillus sp. cl123]SFW30290.1 putative aldouronate transport system substrate-binding protein [Paenibacillus sp. UNCCL117]